MLELRTTVLRAPAGFSVRFRMRTLLVCLGCVLLALAVSVVAIGSGDYPMSPGEVVRTLLGGGTTADSFIVTDLRLPRVATALLAGAALALSGAVFQTLVRNPLGSPDLLGFTQGSASGALTAIMLGGGSAAVASGAVGGGILTGLIIYACAWRQGLHGSRLVLAGIGLAAVLTGVEGYLLTKADITDAARAVLWITGSLDGRSWSDAVPLAIALAVLAPVVLGCSRALGMLELGDEAALALGIRVGPLRTMSLLAAVLLCSFAAAAVGPVAFVALTAPQLARRLTRSPGPNLLPALCVGMALLVSADLLGQRLIPGRQLPAGVLTGALGGCYLIWLLASERKAGRI